MGFIVQLGQAHHSGYNNAILDSIKNAAQKIIDEGNTYATNTTNETNAWAANTVRAANNAVRIAQANLGNFMRSQSNQNRMQQDQARINALQTNLLRTADATLRGSLESRIRASEQLGALASSAAAANMGGGSIEALKSTLNIQDSYQRQVTEDNKKYVTFDATKQKAGMEYDAVLHQDLGQTFAAIDYSQNTYTPVINPIRMGDFMPDPETAAMWSLSSSQAWSGAAQAAGTLYSKYSSGSDTQTSFYDRGYNAGKDYSLGFGMGGNYSSTTYDYTDGYKGQGLFGSETKGTSGLFGTSSNSNQNSMGLF
jgi:hypothetical protein